MGKRCGRWLFGNTNTKDYGPIPPDLADEYKESSAFFGELVEEDTEG